MELLFAVVHSHAISRVDDPDEGVGLFKVVTPVGSQGPLAADVP